MSALGAPSASRTTPRSRRPRAAGADQRAQPLPRGRRRDTADADEAVALSTCNRTELYLVGPDAAGWPGSAPRSGAPSPVSTTAGRGRALHHRGEQAALHLYRVAAGLDSLVPGEAEVLGQVREALALARSERTVGPMLSRLFETRDRDRPEGPHRDGIGRSEASVGSVAAGLAGQTLGGSTARPCC